MKKYIPGLILVIIISILSMLINTYVISFIETLTIAIVIGIFYSNTVGLKKKYVPGVTFSLKKILKWGIVLLGVKLNFAMVFDLGPWIGLIVITLMTIALILSNVFGRLLKLNTHLSTLLGVGSSICGASAIVAMGPVIDADEEDTAIAVAVISLLGAVGILVYTLLSYVLPLTDIQFGIWSGSSLQGVSHALAAAGARGTDGISMEMGTIVKMSRVALLAPVALILSYIFNKKSSSNNQQTNKVNFPVYVILFIVFGIVFSINSAYDIIPMKFSIANTNIDIIWLLKKISSFFILMSMVAMGLKINIRSFKTKGLKALYVCSFVFVTISILSYVLIQFIR